MIIFVSKTRKLSAKAGPWNTIDLYWIFDIMNIISLVKCMWYIHKFFTLQIISGEDFDPMYDDHDVPVLTPGNNAGNIRGDNIWGICGPMLQLFMFLKLSNYRVMFITRVQGILCAISSCLRDWFCTGKTWTKQTKWKTVGKFGW